MKLVVKIYGKAYYSIKSMIKNKVDSSSTYFISRKNIIKNNSILITWE